MLRGAHFVYPKATKETSNGAWVIAKGSRVDLYTRTHFDTFDDTKKELFKQQLAAWHIPLQEYLNQFRSYE